MCWFYSFVYIHFFLQNRLLSSVVCYLRTIVYGLFLRSLIPLVVYCEYLAVVYSIQIITYVYHCKRKYNMYS